jgi:hypothetical protein
MPVFPFLARRYDIYLKARLKSSEKKKVLLSFVNSSFCRIFAARWENPSMGYALW